MVNNNVDFIRWLQQIVFKIRLQHNSNIITHKELVEYLKNILNIEDNLTIISIISLMFQYNLIREIDDKYILNYPKKLSRKQMWKIIKKNMLT